MQRMVQRLGTKDILADQYAYALAAQAAGLYPQQLADMMVSSTRVGPSLEGWSKVEQIISAPCGQMPKDLLPLGSAPLYLHACQMYNACEDGEDECEPQRRWRFNKRLVPVELMECGSPLILAPPEDLFNVQKSAKGAIKRAHTRTCTHVRRGEEERKGHACSHIPP